MVRPRKDPALRMDQDLRIPVNAEQKAIIQQAAAIVGLDMAAWVRQVLLEAAKNEIAEETTEKRRSNP